MMEIRKITMELNFPIGQYVTAQRVTHVCGDAGVNKPTEQLVLQNSTYNYVQDILLDDNANN